jgi:lipopolysaccharide export system protein LptA
MRVPRSLLVVAGIVVAAGTVAAQAPRPAPPGAGANPLGFGSFGGKEPVTVTADRLEYDYKAGVVVYRGGVEVTQGQTKLKSDNLTVKLTSTPKPDKPKDKDGEKPEGDAPGTARAAMPAADDSSRVQEIVAAGNVRIDQGERFAVGGRAIFDQTKRTIVLTEDPVLHDGPNEVQGDRVVVYLDENRSVVEGGRKRVKAVLYPDQKPGEKPGEGAKP